MRYAVTEWCTERFGAGFPTGTLIVNVSGSLFIGILLTLLTEQLDVDPLWRRLIVVGFLGGYTTFSSYTYEAVALAEQGAWGRAGLYVVASNVLALLACVAGVALVRAAGR
jgi:CrcB protein